MLGSLQDADDALQEVAEADLERSTLPSERSKGIAESVPTDASFASEQLFASVGLGVRHAPVIDPGLRVGAADGRGVGSRWRVPSKWHAELDRSR